MGEAVINVNLVLDNKTITVPYTKMTTAEDVCIYVCKQLGIVNLTRHLFALRRSGTSIFLMPSANFDGKTTTVDFRIRFKVAHIAKLAKLDINTYNYYFHQARNDVLENKIPDVLYEKYRRELVGLGITDMYRVMLEKDIPRGSVENEYKKYIPKEVLRRHSFFIKKPIHDTLGKLQKSVHDASYVKAEYLKQLENIAPEYLSETYKAVLEQDGDACNVILTLSPHDSAKPGLKYYMEGKKDQQWQLICAIEDLSVISINNRGSVEISRRDGIPVYLRFHSKPIIYSFISLLDGYYRLTCKWTFNICSQVETPSLRSLHAMKCHGPVGGEFSYAKLEAKRANKAGCFIIRESESKYNNYFIDVCLKDGLKPKTFKLEKITGDEFIFNDDLTRYKNIHQLMASYNDPNGAIWLKECLPPSEYDDSPLLLCKSETMIGDSLTDSTTLNVLLPTSPMCINCKDLQVYKGRSVYILPQWKEAGIHGGLRFSIKQWNPDEIDGLHILIQPKAGSDNIVLQIGAENNEKIILYYNNQVVEQKTFPHLISTGEIALSDVTGGLSSVLIYANVKELISSTNWTRYDITFNETDMGIARDNETVLYYKSAKPMMMYWFVLGVREGWMIWTANCEPLDLDGPPRDGGWSRWSPWTCTVSCGGGEGFRTRTCSNPRPNVFGSLCQGSPTSTGKCNDFPCGDVSPETLEKIREHLQRERFSYVIEEGQKKEGSRGITVVFRSMWKVAKGKKIEVAMKMLKEESADHYVKDMINLAGQWAFLRSNVLVRLYGIAFTSNISMVLEYFKLGPLDQYLRESRNVQTVHLVQAASNLASALWHLTENGIVHGNIRCRKLMVYTHEAKTFSVKLTDPGIHTSYASSEVHWIPIECYSNLNYAKRSSEADVWSFGTTLWEIFMFGEEIKATDHNQLMRWYISGNRLSKPSSCLDEIYDLMVKCWDIDPHKRMKPQVIMRDINQLLYQLCDVSHAYETVRPKLMAPRGSLTSITTESTALVDFSNVNESDHSGGSSLSGIMKYPHNYDDSDSYDLPNIISMLTLSTNASSMDSLNSVVDLDENCNVVLQGRIGQGFYGEVFKGSLEYLTGQNEEFKKVAVKKLKAAAGSSCLQDFEREINIMKALDHPNIVKILGVKREPEICLVMEFVQHGSLQSYLKIYKESLQEGQLLKYALDIAKGMDYLGKKNIVHRDLAARNILVVDENHVKISDFGLAQVMGTNDYYILKTTNRELPIKWYSPESLRDGKFSTRSDVWSYGVTMCEMFNYGEEPNLTFVYEETEGPQQQALLNVLERGARFPCPPDCPMAVYIRLIYPCWQADPHLRPLFVQIINEIEEIMETTTP